MISGYKPRTTLNRGDPRLRGILTWLSLDGHFVNTGTFGGQIPWHGWVGEAEASGRRGTGSPATHASWVRPHLRRQPYGPGRSLRRLQLIDGHVRRADLGDPVRRDRVWRVD